MSPLVHTLPRSRRVTTETKDMALASGQVVAVH